jgi:S1-C subfamily serine protease
MDTVYKPFQSAFAMLVAVATCAYGSVATNGRTKAGKGLTQMIDLTRSSVVRVNVSFPNGDSSSGTGFVVNNEGYVVTANHVINVGGEPASKTISAQIPSKPFSAGGVNVVGNFLSADMRLVDADVAHDVAILKPERQDLWLRPSMGRINGKLTQLSDTMKAAWIKVGPVDDGEPVFTSGFPLNIPVLITTSGAIASSTPWNINRADQTLDDSLLVDISINHGNSGGPVFSTKSGEVIGLIDAFENARPDVTNPAFAQLRNLLVYNSELALAVPSGHIVDLLKKNHVQFNQSAK